MYPLPVRAAATQVDPDRMSVSQKFLTKNGSSPRLLQWLVPWNISMRGIKIDLRLWVTPESAVTPPNFDMAHDSGFMARVPIPDLGAPPNNWLARRLVTHHGEVQHREPLPPVPGRTNPESQGGRS